MTEDFLWGGFNIRKFCRILIRNIWMVIAVMIITYLGLGILDKLIYTPRYTSAAVAAVYPMSSSYRYHTIETVSDLSSKADYVSSVLNSDMFQSGLHNQDLSLQDCTIDSLHIEYTDLLVLHATSSNPECAFRGMVAAFDYYSQFSGSMTGAPELKIIFGVKEPHLVDGDSKIHRHRPLLSLLSGLMMVGLLFFIYAARKTYKTEHRIRKRYKNVRFYSLPFIRFKSEKKGIFTKKNSQEPIKKLALEIKQVLHKCNKKTLLVTSFSDKEGGTALLSELARELAEQDENVILIDTESQQNGDASVLDAHNVPEKNTLLSVLLKKCTVKDALFYKEDLKVKCIQSGLDSFDNEVSYSISDIKRTLSDCLEHGDIVLINGITWYPSHYAQIWHEAVDASIALCRQEDADFFKVDRMLSDLQKGDTYFAGCVLVGF